METITLVILTAYTTADTTYVTHSTIGGVDGVDSAEQAKDACLDEMNDFADGPAIRTDWIILTYPKPSIPETVTTVDLPPMPPLAPAEIIAS